MSFAEMDDLLYDAGLLPTLSVGEYQAKHCQGVCVSPLAEAIRRNIADEMRVVQRARIETDRDLASFRRTATHAAFCIAS